MSHREHTKPLNEAVLLRAMSFLATLTTAAEVRHAIQERISGRDPSDQEQAAFVRPILIMAAEPLRSLLFQLRASVVHAKHQDEEFVAAQVRRFGDLMRLRRTARMLNRVHQRLLSLYPEVSEALVEEARDMQQQCVALLESDDAPFLDELDRFVEKGVAFSDWMLREVTLL